MSDLFAFPDPVNEVSARLVAGVVAITALVALVFHQLWVVAPLAYGFLARVFTGPTLSPLGQLVTRVLTPRIGGRPRYVPGPPKRFAQGIGAVLTTAATVAWFGFGAAGVAEALLGMLLIAATLESVFALCLGCKLFAVLMRIGLVPDEICEACADLSRRPIQAGR